MTTLARVMPLSPEDFRLEDMVVAYLVHRFQTLSKESLAELSSLAPELVNCEDQDTLREMLETMREIVFPELIGNYHEGRAGSVSDTERLHKRMEWIGNRIKDKRRAIDMTQDQLAKETGLPQSHISRLEAGKHSPSFRTLERIASALKIPVGELDPASS